MMKSSYMTKRKRLDARSYREWHMSKIKKLKENLAGRTSQDIEENSCTNIEPCIETVQGITVENQSHRDIGPVSGEALDHGSNLCTTKEPQLFALSEQNHMEEQVSNLTNREGMEASGRALNGEIFCIVNKELDSPAIADEMGEAQEQAPAELPSSRVTCVSPVLQQSQIGMAVGGSFPLEQADVSAYLPSNQVRQNAEASAVFNSQTSEILASCQLDQNQLPLSSSGYSLPSLHSPSQSFVGRDQTHMVTSRTDPLANELRRLQIEEDEARKIHKEQAMQVKSACEKELEEVRKKYDLLRQEADVEYLQKNVALESSRSKVQTNKLLAETLMYCNQKRQSSPVSQEALLSAILELPLLQQCSMPTQTTAATNAGPTLAQLQVVHQLSDLMSFEPVRLQNPLPSANPTLNTFTGHPARAPAPHLRDPFVSLTPPMPMSGITSLTGRPNQATRPGSSWTHQYLATVLTHPDGSPCNSVAL